MKALWVFIYVILCIPQAFAIQDADNDGIPDHTDKCNNLEEDYLGTSRVDGCPNKQQELPNFSTTDKTKYYTENDIVSDLSPEPTITEEPSMVSDVIPAPVTTADLNLQSLEASSFSELVSLDYFNNLVDDIPKQASFNDLIIFSISVVIYAIFIFHFYRFIARRNIFSFDVERRILGGKYKASGEKISAAPRIAAFIGTKFIIFPFVIFGWFLAYSFFILFMSQDIQAEKVFFVSAILIIAIRITSYYSEDLSKDLAKTIPFSILGIFLFDQTFFTIDDVSKNLLELPRYTIQVGAFLIVAITVEIVLSIAYLLRLKLAGKKQRKTDSSSDQPINNSQS